jgi:hypothetical protein
MKKRKIASSPSPAAPAPSEPAATTDPAARELARRRAAVEHSTGLTASLYRHLLERVVGEDCPVVVSADRYVVDLLARFQPRDPVEEMLVAQMVHTHARLMYLNAYAHQQKHLAWSKQMHESADRAANTFRRQMLALAEYRNPRRPRSVTTIGQANIAHQQVVQNNVNPNPGNPEARNATNEQGSTGDGRGLPALPAVAGGLGGAAGERPAGAAVAAEHRPDVGGG